MDIARCDSSDKVRAVAADALLVMDVLGRLIEPSLSHTRKRPYSRLTKDDHRRPARIGVRKGISQFRPATRRKRHSVRAAQAASARAAGPPSTAGDTSGANRA